MLGLHPCSEMESSYVRIFVLICGDKDKGDFVGEECVVVCSTVLASRKLKCVYVVQVIVLLLDWPAGWLASTLHSGVLQC